MKHNCPFLEANMYYTHKENGFPTKFHRKICTHKNCLKCELFLEWYKLYKLNKESSPECFKTLI